MTTLIIDTSKGSGSFILTPNLKRFSVMTLYFNTNIGEKKKSHLIIYYKNIQQKLDIVAGVNEIKLVIPKDAYQLAFSFSFPYDYNSCHKIMIDFN